MSEVKFAPRDSVVALVVMDADRIHYLNSPRIWLRVNEEREGVVLLSQEMAERLAAFLGDPKINQRKPPTQKEKP